MPKFGTHTTKRSAAELAAMKLIRAKRTAGATTADVQRTTGLGRSAVAALLKKLADEGHLVRAFEYVRDGGQLVGMYRYKAAA